MFDRAAICKHGPAARTNFPVEEYREQWEALAGGDEERVRDGCALRGDVYACRSGVALLACCRMHRVHTSLRLPYEPCQPCVYQTATHRRK